MLKSLSQLTPMILWLLMFTMIFLILNKMMHPIIMMILLILFNMLMCLIMSMWKMNFIYSIMMFLIMISGLMIMFMYFSSLISNEQININLNMKMLMLLMLNLIMVLTLMYKNNMVMLPPFNHFILDTNPINLTYVNKFFNIMNIYTFPLNYSTLLTILFILFSFISIIKINSSSHSFSMRKMLKYEKN